MKNITKEIDLGHGITKTVTRRWLRHDDARDREIYAAPHTTYTKDGVTVHVEENPGYMPYGRENAHVWVEGSNAKVRAFKHKENAHAKAFELLHELAR